MPSPHDDCLFCRLVAEGDHVHAADGFVAIRDINPIAETHLLVLPERHVDTFRDIEAFLGGRFDTGKLSRALELETA